MKVIKRREPIPRAVVVSRSKKRRPAPPSPVNVEEPTPQHKSANETSRAHADPYRDSVMRALEVIASDIPGVIGARATLADHDAVFVVRARHQCGRNLRVEVPEHLADSDMLEEICRIVMAGIRCSFCSFDEMELPS